MRIIIADDHPVILMGLRLGLKGQSVRLDVVGEATNGKELRDVLASVPCDLLITDFSMIRDTQGDDGLVMLSAVHETYPSLPVIVLSMLSNPALVQGMLSAGVRAVVDKTSLTKELMIAINAVISGRMYLSENTRKLLIDCNAQGSQALSAREAEVVRMFVQGISVTDIAERTGKSVRTISQQKRDAMRKLGIANDKDLYDYARNTGLL